jgi:hypothetical protein
MVCLLSIGAHPPLAIPFLREILVDFRAGQEQRDQQAEQ